MLLINVFLLSLMTLSEQDISHTALVCIAKCSRDIARELFSLRHPVV